MAKTKPIRAQARSRETGEEFMQEFEIDVSADGLFGVKLTDDEFTALAMVGQKLLDDNSLFKVTLDRTRRKIQTDRRKDMETLLGAYARSKVEFTVEKELVISYQFENRAHYVKDRVSGEIHPNGNYDGYANSGSWAKTDASDRHGENLTVFSAGLGAVALLKITHTTGVGTQKVTYGYPSHHMNEQDIPPAARDLNRFVRLSVNPTSLNVTTVPYNEELAQFLYRSMLAICTLADQLGGLFKDHDRVMLAAQSGVPLLTAPPKEDDVQV